MKKKILRHLKIIILLTYMSGPSKDVTGQYGSVSNNHLESLSVVSNDVEIKT